MNIVSSIVTYKCPRCRKGDLFTKPFNFRKPIDMPATCSVCGQKTEPEPGFYYGAMFLSYIATGFLYLGIVWFLIAGLGLSVNAAFGVLLLFAALSYFKTVRLARSLWIHFIVKYDPSSIHSTNV